MNLPNKPQPADYDPHHSGACIPVYETRAVKSPSPQTPPSPHPPSPRFALLAVVP
ncbi:hypothetical protein SPB21_04080 [Leptothoe sp. ISB3NOV94-8A]